MTKQPTHSAEVFKKNLSLLTDAGLRVFMIPTREQFRLHSAIYDWCTEEQKSLRVWTCVNGWGTYPDRWIHVDAKARDPIVPQKLLEGTQGIDKAFKALYESGSVPASHSTLPGVTADFPHDGVYVFMNMHDAWDKPLIQQFIRQQGYRSLSTGQIVILVVPEGVSVPTTIEDQVRVLEFNTPTFDDLRRAYDLLISGVADSDDALPLFDEKDLRHMIENAAGMAQSEFEQGIGLALVKHGDNIINDPSKVKVDSFIDEIHSQKIEIVRKTDLLELLEDIPMEDVGGLDLAKQWLQRRKIAFSPNAKSLGLDMPRGVLLVGPPGTGKSLWAKAASSILTYPCIKFDVGRVFAKYVGDSEERMRRALKLIEAMAPCVLLVDEIDKAFGGGSGGDGGTTSRVFGTFLTWMQERDKLTAPVFVVMTANNVHGMPPELMRRGRIDEIFAVNFPSLAEREDIIEIHLRKRGKRLPKADITQIARETSRFIGAEIEAAVKEGILTAANDKVELSGKIVVAEARKITPISVAWRDKVEAMQEWAKNNARPSSSSGEGVDSDVQVDDEGNPRIKTIAIKQKPRNGNKLRGPLND